MDRIPRREDAFMVPEPVAGEPGRLTVDAIWGTIRPLELAPGVRTVGELEVIAHIEARLPLIDSRPHERFSVQTLPSARCVPHAQTQERLGEFDRDHDTAVFCNGPQCGATPDAIDILLGAGHPAERLLYYRGGLHDWLTLGLPTVPG